MGSSNVDISFGGCSADLQRRLCSGKNRGYPNNMKSMVRSCNTIGDSDCHGIPIPNAELSSDTLGQYHHSHSLSRLHFHRIANDPSAFQQIFIIFRTRVKRSNGWEWMEVTSL